MSEQKAGQGEGGAGSDDREERIFKLGPFELWGRRREEPLCPELAEAVDDLKGALWREAPLFLRRIVRGLEWSGATQAERAAAGAFLVVVVIVMALLAWPILALLGWAPPPP